MRVDFSDVRRIPLVSVLAHYKIEMRKRSDTEYVAQCTFPSHTSKKHEWTLAISTEKGKFFCHSETCRAASNKPKGGDVIDLVALIENLTPLDAAKKLAELFAIPNGSSKNGGKGDTSTSSVSPALSNAPLAFELKHLDPDHEAIRSRGISLETAMEFGIGFHGGKGSMSNRVCFPLRENGSVVGYAGRAVGDEQPKWKLPNGLVKSFLYGLERCDSAKPLILCESPWAVLWFFQHQTQAAALLGSSLTEAQEALLSPFADIRICLDNDEVGRTAAAKIYERLKARHRVSKAFLKS